MGTRHLIAVQVDGEYKVAQYGQWDGYPSGQGARVLEFLKENDISQFRKKVKLASKRDDGTLEAEFNEIGYEAFYEKYPQYDRDTGAGILSLIMEQPDGIKLGDDIDFAGDSLFCEFAYVIDLDKNVLEVYTGFNKEPLSPDSRFANLMPDNDHLYENADGTTYKYYQIKLVGSYDLDNLPTVKQIEKDCGYADEE